VGFFLFVDLEDLNQTRCGPPGLVNNRTKEFLMISTFEEAVNCLHESAIREKRDESIKNHEYYDDDGEYVPDVYELCNM